MNKTININLGGFFFHIDETAFQKLKRYLDAVSRSLNDDPQGKNEIIADIEARISELLSERITDARQVINEGDIEEIIKIMGKPEDYAEAEENYDNSYTYQKRNTNTKKLFRDGDDKFLGGVAAGLAHYTNVDTIWVRLAFLLTGAVSGLGLIIYIVLWILLPEAQSTAEKLQMEGEPVNIDNIEKKIREEFVHFSEKFKEGASELGNKISSADYEKMRKKTKSGLQDFLDALGKIILAFFKVIGKFIGVLLMFVAATVLISLIIGGFSVGSFEILNLESDFVHYPPFFYDAILPKWLLATLLFILIGVPFLILFVLGLRIISSSVKRFSKTTTLTLLGIWIIALLGLAFNGIEYLSKTAYSGTKIEKNDIGFFPNDTINIKVINDDDLYYQHNFRRKSNATEVIINNEKKVYSNYVKVDIEKSETGKAYIEVRKKSKGRNRVKANKNASEINYKYLFNNRILTLDGYFLSQYKNMYKEEEVYITLYVPENTSIFFENSSKTFLYEINNTDEIYERDMINHHFTMTKKGFKCTDCTTEEEGIDNKNQNNF